MTSATSWRGAPLSSAQRRAASAARADGSGRRSSGTPGTLPTAGAWRPPVVGPTFARVARSGRHGPRPTHLACVPGLDDGAHGHDPQRPRRTHRRPGRPVLLGRPRWAAGRPGRRRRARARRLARQLARPRPAADPPSTGCWRSTSPATAARPAPGGPPPCARLPAARPLRRARSSASRSCCSATRWARAISVLHAAARPEQVRGLALIGPALPRLRTSVPGRALAKQVALFAVPGVAERSLARRRTRLGAEAFVQATLELTCADASRCRRRCGSSPCSSPGAGQRPGRRQAFLEAARSLAVLVTRSGAYRQVLASVSAPGIVLQGRQDRLVPVSGVAQLAALRRTGHCTCSTGSGTCPRSRRPGAPPTCSSPGSRPASPRSPPPRPRADLTAAGPTDLLAGAS